MASSYGFNYTGYITGGVPYRRIFGYWSTSQNDPPGKVTGIRRPSLVFGLGDGRMIINASAQDDGETALQILEQDYAPKMEEIAEICTELSQKAAQESSAQNQRVAALMMASVAVLLVVIILLELLDAKRQNTKLEQMLKIPIREIITAMQELEKGNLKYESSYHSGNEMGVLMDAIRRTTGILNGYIGNVEKTLKAIGYQYRPERNQFV